MLNRSLELQLCSMSSLNAAWLKNAEDWLPVIIYPMYLLNATQCTIWGNREQFHTQLKCWVLNTTCLKRSQYPSYPWNYGLKTCYWHHNYCLRSRCHSRIISVWPALTHLMRSEDQTCECVGYSQGIVRRYRLSLITCWSLWSKEPFWNCRLR